MTYVGSVWGDVLHRALLHAWLAGLPLLVGLAISIPVGWAAHRWRLLRPVLVVGSGLLYTIPSLALFVLMPLIVGTQILDPVNVIIAMTIYTVALLVRSVTDALDSVPADARAAATAMGYSPLRRFAAVDLPLAVPVLAAGLRVAAVSNVSIVSVASLLGISQLGYYLTDGYNRTYGTEIGVGIVACIVLALIFDIVIVLVARALTPWQRVKAA